MIIIWCQLLFQVENTKMANKDMLVLLKTIYKRKLNTIICYI